MSGAGANATWLNLAVDGEVEAELQAGDYGQIWVFDLSVGSDIYPTDWQAIADWYDAHPDPALISDARMLSSHWNGRWSNEGQGLVQNYFENLRTAGGGLMLATDDEFSASIYGPATGMNSLHDAIGIERITGEFFLTNIPVDTTNPLMNTPNSFTQLWNDSTTGQVPYGLQRGVDQVYGTEDDIILYSVAWHSGNVSTPGISSTIRGGIGTDVEIISPPDGAQLYMGDPIILKVQEISGTPPYTHTWESNIDGPLGTGSSLDASGLSLGFHTITVLTADAGGGADRETTTLSVFPPLAPAAALLPPSLGLQDDSLCGGSGDDTLLAGDFDDYLNGGTGNDLIDGSTGDDVAYGRDGDDTLMGNIGADTLTGGAGDDVIFGDLDPSDAYFDSSIHVGADVIVWTGSSDGADTIDGGASFDRWLVDLDGSGHSLTADDTTNPGKISVTETAVTPRAVSVEHLDFQLGSGADDLTIGDFSTEFSLLLLTVDGEAGDDTIDASGIVDPDVLLIVQGGDGADTLIGGPGNDTLEGDGGADTIYGGDGNDVLRGGDNVIAADTLRGGGGDDTILGEGGADTMDGDDGDDSMEGGDGDDTIEGGAGEDTILGNDGADSMGGSTGDDVMNGGEEPDEMFGGAGNDNLQGGDGKDTIDGGAGEDTIFGNAGSDSLVGGSENDFIRGHDGRDVITGGTGADTLQGGNHRDSIRGEDGADFIQGGRGKDTIAGNAHDDTIFGGRGSDSITGDTGDDVISGQGGRDTLDGSTGDDVINGMGGGDLIIGGDGNDRLARFLQLKFFLGRKSFVFSDGEVLGVISWCHVLCY